MKTLTTGAWRPSCSRSCSPARTEKPLGQPSHFNTGGPDHADDGPAASALFTHSEKPTTQPSSSPSCHADFLPCRPFAMPLFGNDRTALQPLVVAKSRPRQSTRRCPTIRQEPTNPMPTHPCHAALLPCRISATPSLREPQQVRTWKQAPRSHRRRYRRVSPDRPTAASRPHSGR